MSHNKANRGRACSIFLTALTAVSRCSGRHPISRHRSRQCELRAFSGKVDADLGFTRDRHSMSPKSAEADLGGFPQKMQPRNESRARFRFNLIGTRSSGLRVAHEAAAASLDRVAMLCK